MKSGGTNLRISYLVASLTVLTIVGIDVPALRAQEPALQQLTAPPPLKVVSPEERARIDGDDSKKRLRTTIELAELRLAKAEVLTSQSKFEDATGELGRYQALIDDALNYLSPMTRDKNKTRDLYKRLELALRAHGPRLTAIRRSTPMEYAVWIKELEEFARQGRTEALNSFYGHTVFREPQSKLEDRPPEKPAKSNSVAPERRP